MAADTTRTFRAQFISNGEQVWRAVDMTEYHRPQNLCPYGADMQYYMTPVHVTCQYCHAKVLTEVETTCNSSKIFMMIMCLLLLLPVGIVYCLTENAKSYHHICRICKNEVGCFN